jgi:hypothetical protein
VAACGIRSRCWVIDRDTSPRATKMLYCGAIATCHEAHEFGRARVDADTHPLGFQTNQL